MATGLGSKVATGLESKGISASYRVGIRATILGLSHTLPATDTNLDRYQLPCSAKGLFCLEPIG